MLAAQGQSPPPGQTPSRTGKPPNSPSPRGPRASLHRPPPRPGIAARLVGITLGLQPGEPAQGKQAGGAVGTKALYVLLPAKFL